jgi:hypothetical protein
MSQIIVPDTSATLGLSHEKVVGLKGNHHQIVKYKSRMSKNYREVVDVLSGIWEIINEDKACTQGLYTEVHGSYRANHGYEDELGTSNSEDEEEASE